MPADTNGSEDLFQSQEGIIELAILTYAFAGYKNSFFIIFDMLSCHFVRSAEMLENVEFWSNYSQPNEGQQTNDHTGAASYGFSINGEEWKGGFR